IDFDREALPPSRETTEPVSGKSEVRVGRIRCGGRARYVRDQARQRDVSGAARTVAEAVRKLTARARAETQRRSPDRRGRGGRRRVEVAIDILIDGERCLGLSGYHRSLRGIPSLMVRSADGGIEGEPAHKGRPRSSRRIGEYLDLDPLSAGRRFVPGTGQSVLIEIGTRGRCFG